jgi:hypothetical protein
VVFEAVVHEPRAGHRLDHPADRPLAAADAAREADEAVAVRRRRELLDDLAARRQRADVDFAATQIQTSVQHENGPRRCSLLDDTLSVAARRPPSWQSKPKAMAWSRPLAPRATLALGAGCVGRHLVLLLLAVGGSERA